MVACNAPNPSVYLASSVNFSNFDYLFIVFGYKWSYNSWITQESRWLKLYFYQFSSMLLSLLEESNIVSLAWPKTGNVCQVEKEMFVKLTT